MCFKVYLRLGSLLNVFLVYMCVCVHMYFFDINLVNLVFELPHLLLADLFPWHTKETNEKTEQQQQKKTYLVLVLVSLPNWSSLFFLFICLTQCLMDFLSPFGSFYWTFAVCSLPGFFSPDLLPHFFYSFEQSFNLNNKWSFLLFLCSLCHLNIQYDILHFHFSLP